ncbi:MAG: thiamine pyrophosphate-dependent enzyme [Nanoarchaeota archaeon]
MKQNNKTRKKNLNTGTKPTWCPGCFNFQILAGVKNLIEDKLYKNPKEKFAIVSGIGCHAKVFDYLNLPGINSIHGRVPPTCLGMKIANPKLNVIGFSGDGDAYSEGLSHLISAARYNSNYKLIIHNNQIFALTVGQPTPVTEQGFKDKTTPRGVKLESLNPIKLMLSSGASFVARVFADSKQVKEILNKALKHKGFAFIEVLQPCLVFHSDKEYKKHLYNLQDTKHDTRNWNKAMKKACEFDYSNINNKTKIPTGIFYQENRDIFEDNL